MSEHRALIQWQRNGNDFSYEAYDRTHRVKFGGGTEIQMSAAPEYRGRADLVNPEEQLVAALSSCHMLTFLAIAAKNKIVVDHYEDDAKGFLEKGASGRLCLARVVLRPKVLLPEGQTLEKEKLISMHEQAHRACFIANSVSTDVQIEPVFS